MRRFDSFSSIVRFVLCLIVLWTAPGTAARSQEEPSVKAFRLRQASAEEVAKTLEVLMPDLVVNVDPRTNRVLVVGTDEVLAQVEEFLRLLDGDQEPQQIRIFPVSHRSPEQAAALLTEILKDDPLVGTVNIIADERTSALIVRAMEEEFDHVEQLLRIIDSEPAAIMNVKVFPLRHADAAAVSQLIRDMFSTAAFSETDDFVEVRVAVDERTNSIIVTGQRDAVSVVEALLMRLDEGEVRASANPEQLQVRILWIVSGDDWTGGGDEQSRLAPLPDELADVARELDALGISAPRIATRMVVNSSGEFSIKGTARLEGPIHVTVSGAISSGSAAAAVPQPTLDISIVAEESRFDSQIRSMCELETTLTVPLDHFVVLGVSPIDSYSSAFVVQVTATAR